MEAARIAASHLPSLRQLQFLLAIQRHKGFVRAAEAVGVTQPTLSAGIKELEAALGAVLVERGRAGAALTPAGEAAAAHAAKAVAEVEDLVRGVRDAAAPFTGLFRLGAIPTIAPYVLPRALPLLKKRYPNLRLQVREDQTARLVDALRARTLDAAIIALPYDAEGIETEFVAPDEFLFVGPKGHPLAEQKALSPDQVDPDDMLLLDDGHCLRDHALSVCRMGPGQRSSDVGATSLQTLVQMVAGGLGVTLLPRLAAEGGVAAGADVTIRPFSKPVIGRSIGVAWRAKGARAGEAKLLAALLKEAVFRKR